MHFFEVNRALKFDRAATFGMRLDRPSGTGIRFEPGEIMHVDLVRIGGTGNVRGSKRLAEARRLRPPREAGYGRPPRTTRERPKTHPRARRTVVG